MRWLEKGRFRFLREQRGIGLIEVIVAVAILGFIGVAFLSGLSTTSGSVDLYQQRVTAVSLAQSQIEEIKAVDYVPVAELPDGTYSCTVDSPSGYKITISTEEPEDGKQKIAVKVSRDGHHLFELTYIKADW